MTSALDKTIQDKAIEMGQKKNITGVRVILAIVGIGAVGGILSAYGYTVLPEYKELENVTEIAIVSAFSPAVSLLACLHLMGERKPNAMRTLGYCKLAGWLISLVAALLFIGASAAVDVLFITGGGTMIWLVIIMAYAYGSKTYKALYT